MAKKIKLGEFLKRRRETQGLSQGDVSEALGYSSPQFVSNWERGLCSPPLTTLPQIVTILKIPRKDIVELLMSEYKSKVEGSFRG